MSIRILALAGLLAFVSGCNDPVSYQATSNVQLLNATYTLTGSPVSKVVMHGDAINTGTTLAHGVFVFGYIGNSRSQQFFTSPSDIAPGETAHWSLTMTGSSRPRLEVYWQ